MTGFGEGVAWKVMPSDSQISPVDLEENCRSRVRYSVTLLSGMKSEIREVVNHNEEEHCAVSRITHSTPASPFLSTQYLYLLNNRNEFHNFSLDSPQPYVPHSHIWKSKSMLI